MADGIDQMRQKKRQKRSVMGSRHPRTVPGAQQPATADTAAVVAPAPPPPAADPPKPARPAVKAPAPQQQQAAAPGALPDLSIDWSDPQMHLQASTRLSVPNSVAARFKAVADQPGTAPQTQLIMEAVSRHLAQLPTLVLERRPAEQQRFDGFFLPREAVQKAEPWAAIYLRPNAGELAALSRIVEWVSATITADHPWRKPTNRSELVTAALAATY